MDCARFHIIINKYTQIKNRAATHKKCKNKICNMIVEIAYRHIILLKHCKNNGTQNRFFFSWNVKLGLTHTQKNTKLRYIQQKIFSINKNFNTLGDTEIKIITILYHRTQHMI